MEYKTGEVAELKKLFVQAVSKRELKLQKDLVKKVCSYMTIGIDVSGLFSDMIMASNTTDMVQKKLVYMYLTFYVHNKENQDLALLAINTMYKDCHHSNPMIRGFALRSLSSLKVKNLVEYIRPMVLKGLQDTASYVRKTAAIATIKLYHISPRSVQESQIVDLLYDMIRDSDTQVIANAIYALNEILHSEGGIATNQSLVLHLLSKMKYFNEWHQILVLEIVYLKYEPSSEDEIFNLLNLLDPMLNHSNHAILFAVTRVFLKFTESNPQLYSDVFKRLQSPLVTFITSAGPEIVYECLKHVQLLLERNPDLFSENYKQFYCLHNDPDYLKLLKTDILSTILTNWNVEGIVEELCDNILEVSNEVAKQFLQTICNITLRYESVVTFTFARLLQFLALEQAWLISSCFVVIADLLRKYPMEGVDVITECKNNFKNLEQLTEQGQGAVIWILGEYGEQIPAAPYLLEYMVDEFDQLKSSVRVLLLTALVKLFAKRPPETRLILGDCLALSVEQDDDFFLKYKAMFYYKLLCADINKAFEIINSSKSPIDQFVEEKEFSLADQIFEEFNTLAVVYGKPSATFIVPIARHREDSDDSDSDDSSSEEESPQDSQNNFVATPQVNEFVLLDKARVKLIPAGFEQKWISFSHVLQITGSYNTQYSIQQIESTMDYGYLFTLASGKVENSAKFYLYAASQNGGDLLYYLIEMIFDAGSGKVSGTIKSSQPIPDVFIQIVNKQLVLLQ